MREIWEDFLLTQFAALMGIVWEPQDGISLSSWLRVRNGSIDKLGYRVLKLHEREGASPTDGALESATKL